MLCVGVAEVIRCRCGADMCGGFIQYKCLQHNSKLFVLCGHTGLDWLAGQHVMDWEGVNILQHKFECVAKNF